MGGDMDGGKVNITFNLLILLHFHAFTPEHSFYFLAPSCVARNFICFCNTVRVKHQHLHLCVCECNEAVNEFRRKSVQLKGRLCFLITFSPLRDRLLRSNQGHTNTNCCTPECVWPCL